ncbi:LysE family translocator [Shimia abyssi]|uniref:Threonine/homoserine/homoserine lactone efflux protein n=1 Tax=Shimia abyssi TaxID=1662395 RepID=A0A2P8F6V5_9RHOB|nr:LysE family translocator [Shimia abyssi]PSL17453.1 threonine/homoserine/homoserine lactone efflux protein [Shimia abyssi]
MNIDTIAALAMYAFVTSITPGPNNLMLMSSGANFGFVRSIPHMMGIGTGFVFMILLVGIGLMQAFDMAPISYEILKVASIIYLLWLSWKIANAGAPSDESSGANPLTFLQAALFQWVNPKAWSMALAAITLYANDRNWGGIVLVAVVFGAINLPCVSSWTVLGQQMRKLLTSQARLTAFNWTMAALLVASLYPVILSDLG